MSSELTNLNLLVIRHTVHSGCRGRGESTQTRRLHWIGRHFGVVTSERRRSGLLLSFGAKKGDICEQDNVCRMISCHRKLLFG